jgi:hypothetical protein
MTKKLLGEQARTRMAQTDSGIYRGEIVGETDMHVLQRLSPRTVIAHLKHLLRSIPDIGSELSITYSRHTTVVRTIQRQREQELGR